jgi:hypothetical protein
MDLINWGALSLTRQGGNGAYIRPGSDRLKVTQRWGQVSWHNLLGFMSRPGHVDFPMLP